ncbi:MAG: DUF3179 domain-containing protein [Desulfobacterales bacterium]|nr:DUF3179 domain-containing protein [Desulfobacterales bacterium]
MQANYKNRWRILFTILTLATVVLVSQSSGTTAVKEGEKVYIVDQTGEHWDITQAVSIGFNPRYFEFGIGRNAFHPLGENNWQATPQDTYSQMRVIGVTGNGDAHAYSVAKLGSHETANTYLGSAPIVAGY